MSCPRVSGIGGTVTVRKAAYRPLVGVRPYAGAGLLDVCGVVEGEGSVGRDDFDFDVAILCSSVGPCSRGFRGDRL